MKNLGKIVLWCLMSLPVFAGVNVSVDRDTITRGERISFTIKISGEGNAEVPPLETLCGVDIEGRMQSRKDIFANGKREQELSLSYEIMPQKSCVIEAFPVKINDVEYMTESINITVSKMSISKNEPFMVDLHTDKISVYVGEPFEMRVRFQQRNNIQALGEAISLPESKNIWVKSEHKGKGFIKNGYQTRTNMYALSAQQSGKLSLGPLRWDLKVRSRSRDYWGSFLQASKTRSVFSNELDIEVKPLPEGISIVGDLSMKASVDKQEINAGEAVNLTISIEGAANVEDITPFSIHLNGAQAFNEEPKINHFLQDNRYKGSFEQKSALVAEKDFVIPSFELEYMDVISDTVKSITTEPISIKVLNSVPTQKEELKISRAPEQASKEPNNTSAIVSNVQVVFVFLTGLLIGVLLAFIPWKRLFNKKVSKGNISAKESKQTLQLLMGHMGDAEIEQIAKQMSENLYEGASHAIDKKRLKEILKDLQT